MGQAVMSLNKSVKDINVIYPGQKLKLKNPSSAASVAKEPAPAVQTSLVKKTGVTQGVVTWAEGASFIIRAGTTAKKKLTINTIVNSGDTLETGKNGKIELIVNREQVIRIKPMGKMAVSAFRDNAKNEGETRMKFTIGTVWAKVKKFSDKMSRFSLELPNAVAGVHGTVYQASVQSDESADVMVYEGEVGVTGSEDAGVESAAAEVEGPHEVEGPVEVSLEEWTRIVGQMQRIKISGNGQASEPESFEKAADDWEKWNEERDRRIAEMFAREF
jgi:LysM repeat protein